MQENAAIYEFTAQIDDRVITAMVKEKHAAVAEYTQAIERGQTAVLLQQSERKFDTFRVSHQETGTIIIKQSYDMERWLNLETFSLLYRIHKFISYLDPCGGSATE